MNTTKKGNEFEDKIYKLFSVLVKEGSFIVPCKSSMIFRKKEYYSKSREKNIIFDLSIESYLPDIKEPSFIVFIECKNYNHTVQIDDLEEFSNKVNQVAERNSKSVFVTSSNFSDTGVTYAKNTGIALLRVFNKDDIKWVTPRTSNDSITYIDVERARKESYVALTTANYKILSNFAVGYNINNCYYKVFNFFDSLYNENVANHSIDNISIYSLIVNPIPETETPYITENEIKKIANNVLSEIDENLLNAPMELTTEVICNYLEEKYNITICYSDIPANTLEHKIIGLIDYKNSIITISHDLKQSPERLKFTLTHELSHLILHEPFLRMINQNENSDFSIFSITQKESSRIETQANKLTSFLLLPESTFNIALNKISRDKQLNGNRGYYIYLDEQACNINQYRSVVDTLHNIFKVSNEMIKNRLQTIGYLKIGKNSIQSPKNWIL